MTESKATVADQCAINVAAYLYYVEVKAAARLLDVTTFAESFARGVVTTIFGCKDLIVLELQKKNFPAIDLATQNGDIAFQVTISGLSDKVESTLKTFMEHGLDKEYKRLVFIVLGEKQGKYESKKIAETAGTFNFDPYTDIYDLRQIYDLLVSEGNPRKLEALRDLIADELGPNVSRLLTGYRRAEDNLNRVFDAHDVTPTLGARALTSFGIDRQTFCHIDRLNQSLTHEMAMFLAEQFGVSRDWIAGDSSHIYDAAPDYIETTFWRRNLNDAYQLVDTLYEKGQRISIVIPRYVAFDDFETSNFEIEIQENQGHASEISVEIAPRYFVVATSTNLFEVNRHRWLANEPLQHSRIGIYLLFLASEIWRAERDGNCLIDVWVADYSDMRKAEHGELLLIDLLRAGSLVRYQTDYIYISQDYFAALNVAKQYIEKLQDELTSFISMHRGKWPGITPFPTIIREKRVN